MTKVLKVFLNIIFILQLVSCRSGLESNLDQGGERNPRQDQTEDPAFKKAKLKAINEANKLKPLRYYNIENNFQTEANTIDLQENLYLKNSSFDGDKILWTHDGGALLKTSPNSPEGIIEFPTTGKDANFKLIATVIVQYTDDFGASKTAKHPKIFDLTIKPEPNGPNSKKGKTQKEVDEAAKNYKLFYYDSYSRNNSSEKPVDINDIKDNLHTPDHKEGDEYLRYNWTSSREELLEPKKVAGYTHLHRSKIPKGHTHEVTLTLTVKKGYRNYPSKEVEAKKTFKLKVYAPGESPSEKKQKKEAKVQAKKDLSKKIENYAFYYNTYPTIKKVDLSNFDPSEKIKLKVKEKLENGATLITTWKSSTSNFKIEEKSSLSDVSASAPKPSDLTSSFTLTGTFKVYLFGEPVNKPEEEPLISMEKSFTFNPKVQD